VNLVDHNGLIAQGVLSTTSNLIHEA